MLNYYRGKHFCIYFDPASLGYNLRDLGKGLGLFYRISTEVVLRDKAIINLDANYIFITLDKSNVLNLKIFTENGNSSLDPM